MIANHIILSYFCKLNKSRWRQWRDEFRRNLGETHRQECRKGKIKEKKELWWHGPNTFLPIERNKRKKEENAWGEKGKYAHCIRKTKRVNAHCIRRIKRVDSYQKREEWKVDLYQGREEWSRKEKNGRINYEERYKNHGSWAKRIYSSTSFGNLREVKV